MTDQKPREIAAQILQRRDAQLRGSTSGARNGPEDLAPSFTETLLDQALNRHPLSPPDRRLCQELVFGVVRWQTALDWLITRKTPGRTQKPMLQNLLRLGLYQIFWLDRIPNHAAVNETVEQAKRAGFGPQAGFVNAVLRGYLREVDATRNLLAELKNREPHIGYAHPDWLVTRWCERWGAEKARRLLDWNNTPPKTYARLNTLKVDAGKLLEQWRAEEVDYDFIYRDWLGENVIFELKSHPALATLPSFQQGCFYIQDPSTLLAVHELKPQPGEAILDLCAAPGGKATYIAQLMRNEGKLVAHDLCPERLKLVDENSARLGVICIQPTTPQGLAAPKRSDDGFDRILLDAPCSNTGVMRRRVDVRWRVSPEEIERLRLTQIDLLRQSARLLKRGGRLVYSTRSLEREENHQLIEQFLQEHTNFKLERQRELTPFADQVDGAFVATLTCS